MNILQEIGNWAKQLPDWQSDAVRRIFTQNELTAEDESQLLKMLFAANGILDKESPSPSPQPFSTLIEESKPGKREVLLSEIHSLEHVNAIVPGQSLKFGLDGITVIYGENGAGKSGYARVFKHACQAREKGEPILPNVQTKEPSKPAATIELIVDHQNVAVRWKSGAPASDILSEVAVFDSHCARVFIDEANEVVYLPYGLDTFSRLASLCMSLKDKVTAEIREVPSQFDQATDYSETSSAGKFVRTLSAATDPAKIDTLSKLSEKEKARLEELRILVASAKANPPKQKAAQLRRSKLRLEQLKTKVTSFVAKLSKNALEKLEESRVAVRTAKTAADLASKDLFRNDPLQSTGSDAWHVLFEAARNFSVLSAYPDEEFPVVRAGAVCVLCQQSLESEAAVRLRRFDAFVKNDTAKRHEAAVEKLKEATLAIESVNEKLLESDASLRDEIQAINEQVCEKIDTFFSNVKAVKSLVISALAENRQVPDEGNVVDCSDDLQAVIDSLESQARQYDDADKPEEMKKLSDELAELDDRDRLQKHSEGVKTYISRKQREASLKKCEKSLDTGSITRHGTELMERVVTEQLIQNIEQELKRFGLRCVPVQIKKSGQKGKTKHQLTVGDSVKPSRILSEGEQRVIAISSFLAELKTGATQSPIIFDDPVSSLDHRHREAVAKRLVEESKARQVVVFTHDVVMLLALEREAGEQQSPLRLQSVARTPNGPGECFQSGSLPWYACSTKERLVILKNECVHFKKLQVESPDQYGKIVAEFYGKLRETWERAVEEILLNDVIQRFRPSIETQRLKAVSIEPSDYIAIESGMSKCSTYMTGHDSAGAIVSQPPNPDDVASDLKTLDDFVSALKKRLEQTRKSMGDMVKAPAARVSEKRADAPIDGATVANAKQIGA